MKLKLISIFGALFIFYISGTFGQNGNLGLEGRWGNNVYFGQWGSASITAEHTLRRYLSLRGGIQYISFPSLGADFRPAFFHDFRFARLLVEALFEYRRQSSTDNFCAGISAGLKMPYLWFMLGYYHRTIRAVGYKDKIVEPVNLLYEIGVSIIPKIRNWDIEASISNSELLALERAYQPTVSLKGVWYPSSRTGIWLGIGYKPAGVFNLSHNYYQSFLKLGVQYRW